MSRQDWDEIESARLEEEAQRWIEADLHRLECQRAASARAIADHERAERQCLEALMPASATLAEMFRDVERRTPSIRKCRLHEVVVRLRQPSAHCVHVSLRWGRKFALTDAERQLMKSYQNGRRRLQKYPPVVTEHEYHELAGIFDGLGQSLGLTSGEQFPIDRFMHDPAIVGPYIARTVARPSLVTRHYHRANDYRPA